MPVRPRAIWKPLLAACAAAWLPTRALAQQPGSELSRARERGAHVDRVVLMPTAQTQPRGTLFISDYEIVVPSVGYALSDRVQIAATGLSDFSQFGLLDVTLKASVLRTRYVHVAALASLDYARGDNDELPFGRATLVTQLCADPGCRSSFSLAASLVAHDQPDTLLPLALGAGFVGRISDTFDALLEYSAIVNAGPQLDVIDLPVYLAAYGARMRFGSHWALDVTLLRPMQEDDELRTKEPELLRFLGVPFLVLTWRVEP